MRRFLVAEALDFCYCGSRTGADQLLGHIDDLMLSYLARLDSDHTEGDRPTLEADADDADDADLILAYLADKLEWTTHMTSIDEAVLTDEGHSALQRLRHAYDARHGGTS